MAAKNYTEILALVNAGNQMGLSNTIKRDYGIPLDFTSVQPSFEDAVIYAATNTKAYVGQPISVDDKLYIISAEAATSKFTAADATEYDNFLKEVGTIPTGDDASISVTAEGLVTLFGFATAENGKLPMKVNGAIEWKSLEDIGAGDGNDDTTYTFELNTDKNGIVVTPLFNGQPIMEGEEGTQTQKKFEIILDVYTKAEADEKFLAKADYTPYDDTELEGRVKAIEDDYLKAADKYDDTDVKARLDVIEGDYLKTADKYDDTALAGRVKAIEDDYLKAEDKYDDTDVKSRLDAIEADYLKEEDKYDDTALVGRVSTLETTSADHETRIGKVEDFFKTADGESLSEAMDTLIEIQKEIASDNEGAAAMLADIQANTTAIATLNGDATTDGSVDKKIADAIAPLATTEALNGVKATADAAAVKTDVEADLAKKVDVETYNTDKATFAVKDDVDGALTLKADADKVVSNDTFAQFQTDNTQAIADARSGAVADVEAKGYAVATEVAETYATKQDLTDHSNTMATTLNDYAKKADVEAELATKVESAEISHSTETIAEGATIKDGKLSIVVDAYTKAETLDKIAEKITEINGGESAGEVLGALNSYKESNDARVGAIETKNTEQDTAIAAAQTQADKGVADAKTANEAIVTINSTLGTHGDDISAVKGRLTTLETAKGDHETRIASTEGKVTSLETATANNASAIGNLQGKDSELVEEDARLAGLIDTKANSADVYTKGEVDTTVSGINTEIGKKANAEDVYTKTEVDEALANLDQSELEAGIKANSDALAILVGTVEGDATKSARNIAKEEVAAIVGAAPDAMNTLEEVANWIANDETGAAAMASDIAALKSTVDTGDKTVSAYVNDALAAIIQPKASEEITVAEDGTLGIAGVNVNKLLQTEGDSLILDGGDAK